MISSKKKVKEIKQIILVIPKQRKKGLLEFRKEQGVTVAEGGRERYDSVVAGLAVLNKDINIVAIHDSARPLIEKQTIKKAIYKASAYGASLVALECTDTVKYCENSTVINTIPRQNVFLAQTPQVFRRTIIETAYRKLKKTDITDDCQAAEKIGAKIKIVSGKKKYIKITEPQDIKLARFYLKENKC